jgi:hypothetical protein
VFIGEVMVMLLVVDSLFYALSAAKKGSLLPLEPIARTLYLGITLETLGIFHLSHGWQLDEGNLSYL